MKDSSHKRNKHNKTSHIRKDRGAASAPVFSLPRGRMGCEMLVSVVHGVQRNGAFHCAFLQIFSKLDKSLAKISNFRYADQALRTLKI